MADNSFIDSATLAKSQESVRPDQPLTLSLSFRIQGSVREAFSQKNWERAYNKHDKGFLMTIEIDLKSGSRRRITLIKLVRKAALFWTRNPKIPYRIWVSIVRDDTPFYPLTEEEAKSLLFDVNKVIELKGSDLNSGTHKLYTDIKVSWGKHVYIQPNEIKGRSNDIELVRVTTL
ncbi:MAG TPA: hypothetical protein VE521_07715 [Nitrososphaera sp.]|jgi:hypothetical protein|nr:hypothetical protein [Nitrososphaera sp.]